MAAPSDISLLLKQIGQQYDALKNENRQLSAQVAQLKEKLDLKHLKVVEADSSDDLVPGTVATGKPFVSVVPNDNSNVSCFDCSDTSQFCPTPARRNSKSKSQAEAVTKHRRAQEVQRLLKMFALDPRGSEDVRVSAEAFSKALQTRMDCSMTMSVRKTEAVIKELNTLQRGLPTLKPHKEPRSSEPSISLGALIDVMQVGDLQSRGSRFIRSTINALRPTLDEIVEAATAGNVQQQQQQQELQVECPPSWQKPLNITVAAVVLTNMLAMGISMDYHPNHVAWLILEACCAVVFVFEVAIKLTFAGCRVFFRGEAWRWNVADVIIAAISVGDVLLSVLVLHTETLGIDSEGSSLAQSFQVAVLFRTLRLARVIRLVKVVNSPMLKDLANMLVGLVIGMPSLVWVLVFFLLILCVVGLVFRISLGPEPGQDKLSTCGMADDMADFDDPYCLVHYMYGEEFFGTVPKAMFTSFRFMLGDYSSRGGKSIVVAFSQDYGVKFEVIFAVFMIVVIFGLFNIITAIFVDSTIAGLKHNDVRRKYAQQYERSYVQKKLKKLIERTESLVMLRRRARMPDVEVDDKDAAVYASEIELDEEDLVDIMGDRIVKSLMADLDIDVYNPASLFHTCDSSGVGLVTLKSLTEAVLQLRGGPQRSDVVASLLSMRSLHVKLDQLLQVVEPGAAAPALRGVVAAIRASM